MRRDLLLGIDIGTQSTRVALLDLDGRVVAAAGGAYELVTPRPGWAEQDPEIWWDVVVQGIRSVLAKAAVAPGEILAIGCDAQMHATVPLDRNGALLSRAVQLWCDKRGSSLVDEYRRHHDAQGDMALAANPPLPAWIGFKMLWLKHFAPDLYARTATFVAGQGFINHRLTGQVAMDWSEASGSFLLDARTLAWSPQLAAQVGVDLERLPPVVPSTSVIGGVSSEAARLTGLTQGTPVVAGAGDMIAMLISAGLAQAGRALDISGTASDFCVYTEQPVTNRPFMNLHHALPGWIPFGIAEAGGGSVKWFTERLCAAEQLQAAAAARPVYELLDEAALAVEPGSEGLLFLPYLMGERVLGSPFSRGVFFGITHRTTIAAMMRAILEGVCFDLRRTLEIVESVGNEVREVYTTGGGARSALWSQIKADIYGRPVHTLQASEGGVLGSAILAGVGVGAYADITDGANRCVHVEGRFVPNEAHGARYDALYALFLDVHDRLQEPFERLEAIA